MRQFVLITATVIGIVVGGALPAQADKLDDIIKSGKLRCAVMLDFPPMGMRDASNKPLGFNVDTCRDLGKALGVETEIVETPSPDRIPALLSGRADVAIASASDTLERAKAIGFSIPYAVLQTYILTRTDVKISDYDSINGLRAGGVAGSWEGVKLQEDVKRWSDGKGTFKTFQNLPDLFLALQQGQVEAIPVASIVASEIMKSGKYSNFKLGPVTPWVPDYLNIMALRNEYGLINYLNLFINQQVRTGRYQELWKTWISDQVPDLTVPGVYR
jgi:hydroxyproline transporter system substrate-binding protein